MSFYFDKLCRIFGITDNFLDDDDKKNDTPENLKKFFLSEMGVDASNETKVEKSVLSYRTEKYLNGMDRTISGFDKSELKFYLYIPEIYDGKNLVSSTINGDIISFSKNDKILFEFKSVSGNKKYSIKANLNDKKIFWCLKRTCINNNYYYKIFVTLKPDLIPDYYNISCHINNAVKFDSFLIWGPKTAYLPDAIKAKKKLSGIAIQMYGLFNNNYNSQGIGNFSDLKSIIKTAKRSNVDIIGLSPLGILYKDDMVDFSPYRTISRHFINYLYTDITKICDYKESEKLQKYIKTDKYKKQLMVVQNSAALDYVGVIKLKFPLFKMMYENFKQKHQEQNTSWWKEYVKYTKLPINQKHLDDICVFETILEKCKGDRDAWIKNPKYYYENVMKVGSKFISSNIETINLYRYIHFITDHQFMEVKKLADTMEIGLYLDVPVGTPVCSVDVWRQMKMYAFNASIGVPTSSILPYNQKWNLLPPIPSIQEKLHYDNFIHLISSNMRYAGAIRLDHAFFMERLYWVENRQEANKSISKKIKDAGCFVKYNTNHYLAIVNLESHKNKCMIIAEDLGITPSGFRDILFKNNIFLNRILMFYQSPKGDLLNGNFPYNSLCQASNHDMPTCIGYWNSVDIQVTNNCNLYKSKEIFNQRLLDREDDKENIVKIINRTASFYKNNLNDFNEALRNATFAKNFEYSYNIYGAKTASAIYMARLEDILSDDRMQNVPGTAADEPLDSNAKNLFDAWGKYESGNIQHIKSKQSKTKFVKPVILNWRLKAKENLDIINKKIPEFMYVINNARHDKKLCKRKIHKK